MDARSQAFRKRLLDVFGPMGFEHSPARLRGAAALIALPATTFVSH